MNSKKALYFNEAERLYIYEQLTIEETAIRSHVSPRTIVSWKNEGDWDTKRRNFLKSKQSFHSELYEFARKLMQDIKTDLENGEKVDTGRMYAFTKMLPLITKIKEYEDIAAIKQKEQQNQKGLSKDLIKVIEQEILGMTDD